MPPAGQTGGSEEICVISNELLSTLTADQAPKAVSEYEESGFTDDDVTTLRIDFQNILKIDNLISFKNLTKLQLDNNLIEAIEGLGHLTQLQWLDLSFNNIEKIEGLDTLVHLTDLSLHHNQIHKLEGMDKLTKLDVLSIGDNQLETLEGAPVLYLRQFKKLRSINMSGNAMCDDPNYEAYVVAFLPNLRYVDWRRISDETRTQAEIQYQNELSIVRIKEQDEEEAEKLLSEKEAKAQVYIDACVPNMYGSTLFEGTLDSEIPKLFPIPGIEEAVNAFKDIFNENVDAIGNGGLANAKVRREEREMFFQAMEAGLEENRAKGSVEVDNFIEKMNVLKMELGNEHLQGALMFDKLQHAKDDLHKLKYNLMEIEIGLVASIEESISLFDRSYAELVSKAVEEVQERTSKIREAEDSMFKQVSDIAVAFLDKQTKGEVTEGVEVTDDLLMLLRDKTTLTAVMVNAHDCHMMKMDEDEESVTSMVRNEYNGLMSKQADHESLRNRNRIAEICNFFDTNQDELEKHMDEV